MGMQDKKGKSKKAKGKSKKKALSRIEEFASMALKGSRAASKRTISYSLNALTL
jgi:hypothetical protein